MDKKKVTIALIIMLSIVIIGLLAIYYGEIPLTGEAKRTMQKIKPQCNDLIDNDKDGYCDYFAPNTKCIDGSKLGDKDCTSRNDDKEAPDCIPSTEICDGFDNNCNGQIDESLYIACSSDSNCGTSGWTGTGYCSADGNVHRSWVDYKCNNPGKCSSTCSSQNVDKIYVSCSYGCLNGACLLPQCSDGKDNDGDTYIDHPSDLGCTILSDNSELGTVQCDDGIDNDGDGLIDYPKDSGCSGISDDSEVFSEVPFSYIAPKAARPMTLRTEYPYTIPQKLTDGIYASDNPADSAWVEFSSENVNPYFFSVNGYLRTNRPNMAKLLGELGAGTHRADYKWSDLEKTKGVYDWSYLDARTQQAAQYGIKPYFLITGTPAWAQQAPDPTKPPDNPQDYADFIVAFVKHMDATFPDKTSKVIEVWNEINEKFWTGTEEQYLQMLKTTYLAVKVEDPSWRIMAETFSGMQIPEFDYLYSFKEENGESILKKYSDLIAIHPYGGIYGPDEPMDPTIGWSNFALLADNTQRIRNNKVPDSPWGWCCFAFTDEDDPSPNILRNWRQVMIKNGDGDKKLWLSEIGWHRNMFDGSNSKWPYPPDDKRIAELITRLFEKSSEYDFVESVTIYDLWADNTANLMMPYNNAYNYTKTNAYYAFQNLATTDGIVIDLSKSPTNIYPAPQFNIKSVKVSTLNSAQNGQTINRIEKINVLISSDNIKYTYVGQIINNGPKTSRVVLELDNIKQTGRWIKLEIAPETGTSKYLIDEVGVEVYTGNMTN